MNVAVILSYPNGEQQEVMLAGIPRTGDHIRLSNAVQAPSLAVEHVLWVEATRGSVEPSVVVAVRAAHPLAG